MSRAGDRLIAGAKEALDHAQGLRALRETKASENAKAIKARDAIRTGPHPGSSDK